MNWTDEDLLDHYRRLGKEFSPKEVMPEAAEIPKDRRNRAGALRAAPATKRGMNQWEQEFAADLEMQRQMGAILWWGFETLSIRLAAGARYTPDFSVITKFGLRFYEVKGFWREPALVRVKVAAEVIPVPICVFRKRKVSEGGGWENIRNFN